MPAWYQEVTDSYEGDNKIKSVMEKLTMGAQEVEGYTLNQGLLRFRGRLVIGQNSRIKERIFQALHESPLGGHSGEQNTYLRVKQVFQWPRMKAEIKELVRRCDTCKRCKSETVAYPGLLQPLPIPDQAWTNISMDFVEGLPRSEGRDSILVVVDRLTKFAHFIGLTHPYTAQDVARVFLDRVIKLHGAPKIIVSDRDIIFTSLMWQELMKSLGTKLNLSTAYHPQSDGQTERVNQSLETYLRCVCLLQPKEWHKWLSLAQWWYNSSHHSPIKMSPFEALFGFKPPFLPAVGGSSNVAAVEEYLQQRREMTQQLKQELASAQNHMKQNADRRRSEREFETGDQVYLRLRHNHLKSISRGKVSKLSPKYYGPFLVEARIGRVAYRLKLPPESQIHPVFHVSLLKKSVGSQPTSSVLPVLPKEGTARTEPEAVIDRRVIYKHEAPLIQVLVKWKGHTSGDSTWEYLPEFLNQFPQAASLLSISRGLEMANGGGIVTK